MTRFLHAIIVQHFRLVTLLNIFELQDLSDRIVRTWIPISNFSCAIVCGCRVSSVLHFSQAYVYPTLLTLLSAYLFSIAH